MEKEKASQEKETARAMVNAGIVASKDTQPGSVPSLASCTAVLGVHNQQLLRSKERAKPKAKDTIGGKETEKGKEKMAIRGA